MAHALLSPSGAERWLNCPPSARLNAKLPDTSSEYAREGTLVHSLADASIRYNNKVIRKKRYNEEMELLKRDPLYKPEMDEYVSYFSQYVWEIYQTAKTKTPDAILLTEQKLNLTDWIQDGYGYGDAIIIADGTLNVIDLKYGKGIEVSAIENKQMMLYALGAMADYDMLYGISNVCMTIVQPRLDNISTYELPVEDLYTWAETELKPRAALAYAGEGEFKAGEHCVFCKVKATCRARADENMKLAAYEFEEPTLLTDDEIADIITRAKNLAKWAKDVEDYAFEMAVKHGKKWPGFKLVEGRSKREYTDIEAVSQSLIGIGFQEDELFTKKILGITAMESLLGKSRFASLLNGLVAKPPGKPVLVPESDKRPEMSSETAAAADFENIENMEE